jgi:hypothetical protein
VGNQTEPLGLDNLTSNKFEMALERFAHTDTFGSWTSTGIRLQKAFRLSVEERKINVFNEEAAFLTTSVGLFNEDMEKINYTDFSVTGRITADSIGVISVSISDLQAHTEKAILTALIRGRRCIKRAGLHWRNRMRTSWASWLSRQLLTAVACTCRRRPTVHGTLEESAISVGGDIFRPVGTSRRTVVNTTPVGVCSHLTHRHAVSP